MVGYGSKIAGRMTLYLLNILDLLFTLHAVNNGGVELNPAMRCVPFMVFYKTIVVGVLCWWLRSETTAMRLLTAVYAAVNAWHLYNILGVILMNKIITIKGGEYVVEPDGHIRAVATYYITSDEPKPYEGVEDSDRLYVKDTREAYVFDKAKQTWYPI